MIYLKSVLAGLGTVVLAPVLFFTYVWFAHLRQHQSEGLTAVAGGRNEIVFVAALLFGVGSGLMYWHLR